MTGLVPAAKGPFISLFPCSQNENLSSRNLPLYRLRPKALFYLTFKKLSWVVKIYFSPLPNILNKIILLTKLTNQIFSVDNKFFTII